MSKQKGKLKPTKTAVQKIKPNNSEQWLSFGGGCYLVVAKAPSTSKRFVGATTIGHPENKTYKVPLGIWEKDFDNPQDALNKWNEMKSWGKENNRDLRDFSKVAAIPKSTKTVREVFEDFIKQKETEVVDITTTKNRLNHILKYLNGDLLITDFAGNAGRRFLIETVIDPKVNEEKGYTAMRFRRLLNQVFTHASNVAFLEPALLPYGLDKQLPFEKQLTTKSHPHLEWEQFRDDFLPKVSMNESGSGRLANLAVKASMLTLTRVSTVVQWKWDWYDPELNYWIIPSDTKGIKRYKKYRGNEEYNHYIPQTPQLEVLMNYLYQINGNKEYAFFSCFKGNNPYMSASTPNDQLKQLGFQGLQDIHGLRHVASTALAEAGYEEGMIGKCLGQKNNNGVMKHYNKAKYLEQRREINEKWHSLLIENGLRI